MHYYLGDLLSDYGFQFFEKLHAPLFLLHRDGKLKKTNEAGRKLLRVMHLDSDDLNVAVQALITTGLRKSGNHYHRIITSGKKMMVCSKYLERSDYILVEVRR